MNIETPALQLSPSWVSSESTVPFAAVSGLAPCQAPPAHLFVTLVRICDLIVLSLASAAATALCGQQGGGDPADPRVIGIATLAAMAAFLAITQQLGAYDPIRLRSVRLRGRAIVIGAAGGALAAAGLVSLYVGALFWLWPVLWAGLAMALATLSAAGAARIASAPANADRLARRVAIVGINDYSQDFAQRLAGDKDRGLTCVGSYADRPEPDLASAFGARDRGIADLILRSRRERIDAIVLALPPHDIGRIQRARAALSCVPADIYIASELIDLTCKAACVDHLGDSAVIKIGSRPLDSWQVAQKSLLDLSVATVLLALALPFLALIALLIRLDSKGPVLFRQPRLGFNNNLFSVYKFRTMHGAATDLHADRQTTRDDPRVTRIGRLLRRTSLDEVPQLLNVLRGEMSLVGPRPHALNTKAGDQLFQDAVADYALRHRVRPGITGWAQVNGWRGQTRTRHEIEQRVAHDLFYIDNWSIWLDLRILAATAMREFLTSKDAF